MNQHFNRFSDFLAGSLLRDFLQQEESKLVEVLNEIQ
jgi:hypothetical protein